MGDRVLVQFEDNQTGDVSPVCYMHWSGDSAKDKIAKLARLMTGRSGDLSYAFGRFVGVCHDEIPGNCSLGVMQQSGRLKPEDSHGDAGCYVVDCNDWSVEAFGGYGESFNALEYEPREFEKPEPEVPQHKKIAGYRDLSEEEIELMNTIKQAGELLGSLVENLRAKDVDQRWVSIGQTDLQTGIMALVRSVAQPTTF